MHRILLVIGMSKLMFVSVSMLLALGACKSKKDPNAGSGFAGAPADGSAKAGSSGAGGSAAAGSGSAAGSGGAGSGAGSDDGMDDDEPARQGKTTGLGSPTEKAEVATEDLLRAIAAGKADAKRFVDPKVTLVHRVSMPGATDRPNPPVKKDLCGAAAETAALDYIKAMVARETRYAKDEVGQIGCSNTALAKEDMLGKDEDMSDKPTAKTTMKFAECGSGGMGEYDEVFHVVFVPDATRGVRIAAIVSTEQGASNGALWTEIGETLAAAKPCK